MAETKPVLFENVEFERRGKSKGVALLKHLGLSGLWRKARNHGFYDGVLLDK